MRMPHGGLDTTRTPPPFARMAMGPSSSRSTGSSFSLNPSLSSAADVYCVSLGCVRSAASPWIKSMMPSTPAAIAARLASDNAPPWTSLPMITGAAPIFRRAASPISAASSSTDASKAGSWSGQRSNANAGLASVPLIPSDSGPSTPTAESLPKPPAASTRMSPGATRPAIMAPSMRSVAEPHMGSTRAGRVTPRSRDLSHAAAHPARLNTPAAADSLSAAR